MRALKSVTPALQGDFTGSQMYNFQRVGKHVYLIPKEKHNATLIWMHGLSDNADNYLALFNNPEFTPLKTTTKVVMLTAKEYPSPEGEVRTSWYERTVDGSPSETGEESRKFLLSVLEEEAKLLGGDTSRLYIGGFSQGCAMSLLSGLSFDRTLGGILGFSGFMFPFTTENEKSTLTPIILYHGTVDDRIPLERAEQSYQQLKKMHKGPLHFEIVENVAHAMSLKAFEMIKNFIQH